MPAAAAPYFFGILVSILDTLMCIPSLPTRWSEAYPSSTSITARSTTPNFALSEHAFLMTSSANISHPGGSTFSTVSALFGAMVSV